MQSCYELDPGVVDGCNQELSTLDTWKPREKNNSLVMSEWRLNKNDNSQNNDPGIDDLKKIMMHLKNKKSDADIMKYFGITSEILVAIKRGCYSPVNGISLDNQSKIYNEFTKINKKLDAIKMALGFLSDNLFKENICRAEFRKLIGYRDKDSGVKGEVNSMDDEEE